MGRVVKVLTTLFYFKREQFKAKSCLKIYGLRQLHVVALCVFTFLVCIYTEQSMYV